VGRLGGGGREAARQAKVPCGSVLARCRAEDAAWCAHPGRLPAGLECEVDGGGADDRGLILKHLVLGQRQLDQVVCEPGVVRGSSREQ